MSVNPFCSPRFRASESGTRQLAAFAFGVPHDINGFHPYTVRSASLSRPLKFCSISCGPPVEQGDLTQDLQNLLRTLYAQ